MAHPGGRPTKYKKEYCQEIVEFMAEGRSQVGFCATIGITEQTLYRWAKEKPEFSESITLGQARSQLWWEEIARKNLVQYGKEKFNSIPWVFIMKNRFKWRDNQSIELTGKDGAPIKSQNVNIEADITELAKDPEKLAALELLGR